MRRREFITLVGGVTTWPLAARAENTSKKIPVVGVLWHAGSAEEEDVYLTVVKQALADLGYIEGKNIRLENRFPAEQPDRFRTLARELVELKPDVIIAVSNLGAIELKKITNTIPIVLVIGVDPVAAGIVESLARPGGNVTGTSVMTTDTSGKRLGLLKEAVPYLSRVALLVGSVGQTPERYIKSYQAAAESHGISLWPAEVTTPNDIEPVIAKIAEDHADGLVLAPGGPTFVQRARIGASVLAHRLPAIGSIGEEVPYGLLMSYGADFPEFFRRSVAYTDKILKGAKPADLPVEQPSKFKLVLNLKTAKALSLTVPQTLLISADEVIE